MKRMASLALASMLGLSACGTASEDRAVSGAGIGAAGGAVIGAITGLTVVEGAALGALGGALTGVLSDPGKLNLGKPFWRQGAEETGGQASAAGGGEGLAITPASYEPGTDRATVARVQTALSELGYDPGPVDGILGPKTASAIRQYQREHNLLVDGRPSPELARRLQENLTVKQ
ncbi:MAG: peptidoglycan-binding protein [Alphaproteobacteria bacterium]|nr:MAG: peptidoglycan-binding protein [Alphaproteobacteria bacterium]